MTALNDRSRKVEKVTWRGVEFAPGDRISFDDKVWLDDRSHLERELGTITELWIEDWHDWRGNATELIYAETDVPEPILNSTRRVWFDRDKPAHASELEGIVGASPEGALW